MRNFFLPKAFDRKPASLLLFWVVSRDFVFIFNTFLWHKKSFDYLKFLLQYLSYFILILLLMWVPNPIFCPYIWTVTHQLPALRFFFYSVDFPKLSLLSAYTPVTLGLNSLFASGGWVFLRYILIFCLYFIQHFFLFKAGRVHFVMLPEIDQHHLFLSPMFVILFL